MALLSVTGVTKSGEEKNWVNNINFTQHISEKIAIAGETGSGKSTLLKIIAGLEQPTSGDILLNGEKVVGPMEKLIPGHPRIAYLSQHFELRNNYRVHEILSYANQLSPETATRIYQVCRIEHLLLRRTHQLSGGERQRIALARLLTGSPALLLLDEPFSNLDPGHKKIIKSVVDDISEQLQITCILVSHDGLDVLPWAERLLIMKDGEMIQNAGPETIYRKPINEYCAGLFGHYQLLDGVLAETILKMQKRKMDPGKKLLVRPEQFSIGPAGNITGSVQRIAYYGAYYLADVLINNQLIQVITHASTLSVGDNVMVSFAANEACFV